AKMMRGEDLRQAVVTIFAQSSEILAALPFDDIQGNALRYMQEGALPGIGFRGVNEAYTEGVGVMNPVTEPLTIYGGDLDVDRFIVQTNGEATRNTHEALKIKALAQNWHLKVIKGDSTSNVKEFDGLQARLTGSQVISNSAAANGAALSLTALDELIDAVDNPTHLIMSKAMRRGFSYATRSTTNGVGANLEYGTDAFGRRQMQYAGLPMLVADANDIASSYAALGNNEVYTGGGTADGTSIYCVSFSDGMLGGIQNGSMQVRDLGELDDKPVFRTRVEWYAGLAIYHPRAAARLRDVNLADNSTAPIVA
ncbi:MAG: major capsid protein, partial [Mycobacterium sp.]